MAEPVVAEVIDSAVYKTLLESTKAIPWKIDWATKQFGYIGPQIEALLGWTLASWVTVQDWAERIHEDDRDRVLQFCVAQSQAGVDHEADYRALSKTGQFVWIRDVVHVVRKDDGAVDSLVGFMFDISERKKNEEQLIVLQRVLEDLSFKDGLTNVANRRRFDALMEIEWANARRNRQPLSLIMLDIDYFKQYNDCYGHVEGDACLKRVARVLGSAATRARDTVARIGGEEFVLILPEADEAMALKLAERCRTLIAAEQIPHAGSAVSTVLTVSFGVGSIIPEEGDEALAFIEQIDRHLYQAKQLGRNRIAVGG
ncbi:MAG: sensor domain-containing diguanylate cyclase [Rhodanobacter sp.]